MIAWLKKHSIEIILLVVCCSYFGAMAAPDMTWVNTDCDGSTYLASADYLVLSHPSGAPLYNLFNATVIRAIPFGTEYWRLCMMSAIAAGATCLLLYLIAKRYSKGRWKAMIAPLVYCASGIVVSQATILDTYSIITFISVLAYYFHISGKIRTKYLILGLGLAIHHLTLIPLGVIWIADLAKNIQNIKLGQKVGLVRPAMFLWLIGALFYIYVPLVIHRSDYNWMGGDSFKYYVSYFFGQGGLIGGLAIFEQDGLLRLYDFITISALSFACSGLLIAPGIWFSYKRKDYEGVLLSFLLIFYIVYYLTNMAPQTYVYMMPAFAFGGLLAVKGAGYITKPMLQKWAPVAVGVSSIGLMIFNLQTYDIGRTLDKDLAAREYYNNLSLIPDETSLWIDQGGIYKATVWLYNLDNDIGINVLPRYGHTGEWNIAEARQAFDNGSLLIQDMTDPYTWVVEIRQAEEDDFPRIEEWATLERSFVPGMVKASWSNPVDLITGKVEAVKWHIATKSSLNAGFLLTFGLWGIGCTYVGDFFVKRNKAMDKRKRVLVRGMILAVGICLFIGICALAGMQLAI